MANSTLFEAAEDSIGWANEAIDDLESELQAFFRDPSVKESLTEFDADSGKRLLKCRFVKDLPKKCRRRATEALNNTRHSFDQIINAAAGHLLRKRFKNNFPWARNPTDLQRLLEIRKFPQELWPAIEAQEPYYRSDTYSGGDDLIRNLATVANQKHTVGLSVRMQATGVRLNHFRVEGAGAGILGPKWDAVNKEIVIAEIADNTKLDTQYSVRFQVFFKEGKLLDGTDVMFALKEFAGRAENLLNDAKAVCAD